MGQAMTQKQSLAEFEKRKKRAEKRGQINNSSLPAGSPMYFYCKACGIHHATLPENFLTPPPILCGDCQAMKDVGLVVS